MVGATEKAILEDPEFQRLARLHSRVSWSISLFAAATLTTLIAAMVWAPEYMGKAVAGSGFLTIAMVAGFAIIVLCLCLTGGYLYLYSRIFEPAQRRIVERIAARG